MFRLGKDFILFKEIPEILKNNASDTCTFTNLKEVKLTARSISDVHLEIMFWKYCKNCWFQKRS